VRHCSRGGGCDLGVVRRGGYIGALVSYLVFARKYRPQSFTDVLGQEHVGKTLLNALKGGRLAHAYLFAGPRGVGKTTMARLLAKSVNCLVSPGAEPCNECESCVAIQRGTDVDVIEIDAASNRKVEDVEPLIDTARYLPQRSARKVFVVDEAHMLSRTAWNALLKTLEEPPDHVLFVFATTEPQKVIETVRSRCQNFDFKRITPADIQKKLRRICDAEGLAVEDAVLAEIAARSTGGLRDAETLLDQLAGAAEGDRTLGLPDLVAVLGETPLPVRFRILRSARAGELEPVLDAAAEVVDRGADPGDLLRTLYGDVHSAAVALARRRTELAGESLEDLSVEWCLAGAEVLARHQALADRSRAPRATLDLALLALAKLGDVVDLEDLVARLESMEGGAGAAPAAAEPEPAPAPRKSSPSPASRPVAAPAPPPARESEPPPSAAPARPSGGEKSGGRLRLSKNRPPESPASGLEEAPSPPLNEEQTKPRRRRTDDKLSSEEKTRIENLPRVKEVLSVFGGRIENVRRTDG